MKKVMMIATFTAALVSCQSKGTPNNDAVAVDEGIMTVAGNDSSAVAVYEGILPAADGPGIRYVLSVSPDGESGYTLVTTYLDAEGPGKNKSFNFQRKERSYPERRRQQEENSHQADPERRGHSGVLRSSERHYPAPCQRQPAGSSE